MCEIEIAMSQSFYPNSLIHCMDATQRERQTTHMGGRPVYVHTSNTTLQNLICRDHLCTFAFATRSRLSTVPPPSPPIPLFCAGETTVSDLCRCGDAGSNVGLVPLCDGERSVLR